MMKRPYLYAVAGRPILHSKSPVLMNAAFSGAGTDAFYTRLRCQSAGEVIESMLSLGLNGINVTAPFKKTLIPFLDHSDMSVIYAGALNTIIRKRGSLIGYNTDYIGVVNSFKESGCHLAGKRFLIIGAGGAARAAAFGLRQNYARVTIVNRTFEKAQKLAAALDAHAAPIANLEAEVKNADCIVNTVGDNKILLQPEWLNDNQWIMDANYKNSQLLHEAEKSGSRIIPGEKWLFNQAVPAYYIFRGKQPDHTVMQEALSKSRPWPQKIVIFSDTLIDRQLIEFVEKKTGMETIKGDELDVFTERTIHELNEQYLKILLFSDHYAENKPPESTTHSKLYFSDILIPRRLRKNNELSDIIYEEISQTFRL